MVECIELIIAFPWPPFLAETSVLIHILSHHKSTRARYVFLFSFGSLCSLAELCAALL